MRGSATQWKANKCSLLRNFLFARKKAIDCTFIETLYLPYLCFGKLLLASVFAVARKKQKLVLERGKLGKEIIFLYFKMKNVYEDNERDISVS